MVGLGNSGKTTLLNVLSEGTPMETVPTVGLNVRMIKKGGVNMKCWDLAGGEQYRNEWGRFTKGCDVIIFVVDANAMYLLPEAKKELHRLLEDRELAKTAILIVANKIDLEPHASEPVLIRGKYRVVMMMSVCFFVLLYWRRDNVVFPIQVSQRHKTTEF